MSNLLTNKEAYDKAFLEIKSTLDEQNRKNDLNKKKNAKADEIIFLSDGTLFRKGRSDAYDRELTKHFKTMKPNVFQSKYSKSIYNSCLKQQNEIKNQINKLKKDSEQIILKRTDEILEEDFENSIKNLSKYKQNKARKERKEEKNKENLNKEDIKKEIYENTGLYNTKKLKPGELTYNTETEQIFWKGRSNNEDAILSKDFKNLSKEEFIKKYTLKFKNEKIFKNPTVTATKLYEKAQNAKNQSIDLDKKVEEKYKDYLKTNETKEKDEKNAKYMKFSDNINAIVDEVEKNEDELGSNTVNALKFVGNTAATIANIASGNLLGAIGPGIGATTGLIGGIKQVAKHVKKKVEQKKEKKEKMSSRILSYEELGLNQEDLDKIENKKNEKEKEKEILQKKDKNINEALINRYVKNDTRLTDLFGTNGFNYADVYNNLINMDSDINEDENNDDAFDVLNNGLDIDEIKENLKKPLNNNDNEDNNEDNLHENQLNNDDKTLNFLDLFRKNKDMSSDLNFEKINEYANYLTDVREAKNDEQYLHGINRGQGYIENQNNLTRAAMQGDSGTLDMKTLATQNDINARNTDISREYLAKKRELLNSLRENRKTGVETYLNRYKSFITTKEDLNQFKDVIESNIFDSLKDQKLAIINDAISSRNKSEANNADLEYDRALARFNQLGYVANDKDAAILNIEKGTKDAKNQKHEEDLELKKYLNEIKFDQLDKKQQMEVMQNLARNSLDATKFAQAQNLNRDKFNFQQNKQNKDDAIRMADMSGQVSQMLADEYGLNSGMTADMQKTLMGINSKQYLNDSNNKIKLNVAELGLEGKTRMANSRTYTADKNYDKTVANAEIAERRALGVQGMKNISAETIANIKSKDLNTRMKALREIALERIKSNESIINKKLEVEKMLTLKEQDLKQLLGLDKTQTQKDVAESNNANKLQIATEQNENKLEIETNKNQVALATSKWPFLIEKWKKFNGDKKLTDLLTFIEKDVPNIANSAIGAATVGMSIPVFKEAVSQSLMQNGSKYTISSPYGAKRSNGKTHMGVDYAVPIGTKIRTPYGGVVHQVSRSNINGKNYGYGTYVTILHSNGRTSTFGHLNETHLNRGDVIKNNELIGKSGNTGNSSGPHLHYEIREKDGKTSINPFSLWCW